MLSVVLPASHGAQCTSHAYFPEHKVILCTVPKSSSSSWRQLGRRVHGIDNGNSSVGYWCGTQRDDFNGCLWDQKDAPPRVTSFEQLQDLVHNQGYTPAVFVRDPIERVLSMYTGTEHLYRQNHTMGVNPQETSFDEFVTQLENHSYGGNQHMAEQMKVCNFGRSMSGAGIPWKVGVSSPVSMSSPNETTSRAQRFVADLFGEQVLAKVMHGWMECKGFGFDEFFTFDSAAKREASLVPEGELADRIRALFADDVHVYEEAELDYDGAVPAPGPDRALTPQRQ